MENNQVKDMVNDLSVRNHQLQDEIDRLKKLLSEIKPEDPTLRDTIARLERMVEDLRQRLKLCQDELGAVAAENGALKVEVARNRDAYETLDQQHRSCTSLSKATGSRNCLCWAPAPAPSVNRAVAVHTRTRARARAHTHAHTHMHNVICCLGGSGRRQSAAPVDFLKPFGLECARMPPTCVRVLTHCCNNKNTLIDRC